MDALVGRLRSQLWSQKDILSPVISHTQLRSATMCTTYLDDVPFEVVTQEIVEPIQHSFHGAVKRCALPASTQCDDVFLVQDILEFALV